MPSNFECIRDVVFKFSLKRFPFEKSSFSLAVTFVGDRTVTKDPAVTFLPRFRRSYGLCQNELIPDLHLAALGHNVTQRSCTSEQP